MAFISKQAFTSRQGQENKSLTVLQVAQLQFVRSAEDPSCWAGFMEAVVGIVPRGRIKFVRGRYKGQKVVNFMRLARAPGPEDQWRGRCY